MLGIAARMAAPRALIAPGLKRQFTQNTLCVCTPPRVKVSTVEKICHAVFLSGVWMSGILYSFYLIPKWREANSGAG